MTPHSFLVVLTIGLGSLAFRVIPLLLAGRFQLPRRLVDWMEQIPVAVISSLLFTEIFWRGDHLDLKPNNLFVWAALPTALVGFKSRSLLLTILTGVAVILVARRMGLSP